MIQILNLEPMNPEPVNGYKKTITVGNPVQPKPQQASDSNSAQII